jgi:uncharacterized membrane protein YraQ (UPF0718 family)
LLSTSLRKKRLVGALLFLTILALFFAFNRFPKLDIVGEDLVAVTAPQVQCFQGFCIERDPGTSFLKRWVVFSVTYLRLVTVGMTFAFLVAGLTEAFLFPAGSGASFSSGSAFKRTVKGMALGPVMNLCSACIVPVSGAFQRRGAGIEGTIAMVQGSATMNIPALAMVFFVFTPMLGFSRLVMAIAGALLLGPLVVLTMRKLTGEPAEEEAPQDLIVLEEASSWRPAMSEAFREWAKTSVGYLLRLGPIMVVAGFASGLVIEWVSPETVSTYLGNDVTGVLAAATFGVLINVPLLFEIPLVALFLLLGMGTAPAATLLFAAAAGGPVTFWGLAKFMPKRAIATFATGTWVLSISGGLAVLGVGAFVWDSGEGPEQVKSASATPVSTPTSFAPATTNANTSTIQVRRSFFSDKTRPAGVEFLHDDYDAEVFPMGAGVVVFDFDGDGYQDIYVSDSAGPNPLYRNNGDGTFEDVAGAAGVDDPDGRGNGGCAADYDNDGDRDLYVTNYGSSKLFANDGGGTFTDVTMPAGLDDSESVYRSTGCAWGDYDRDGYVDLIVVRYLYEVDPATVVRGDFSSFVEVMALSHNNGDGTFTNVTSILGDTNRPTENTYGEPIGNLWGAGFQPGWADLDNDGDADLYVVNDWGPNAQPNVLWRNDGAGPDGGWRFTDISTESGADAAINGMGLAIADYDLDGFLDMYVTNIGDNILLRNQGSGLAFVDAASDAGAGIGSIGDTERVTWGAAFLDYDNDGLQDLYVVSGFLSMPIAPDFDVYQREQPNVLLRNAGNGIFNDVSVISGANDQGMGRGGAYLDYDNDGCLDLFVANLGQKTKLFQNNCLSGHNWLVIETVGAASNRDGIGTRIELIVDGTTQIREIAAGGSQMGQNMLEAHFGLGKAEVVESITLRWPSGQVQTLTGVDVNQRLTIAEPSGETAP